MRASTWTVLLGLAAAAATPAVALAPELLNVHGLAPRGTGGRVRASFAPSRGDVPEDLRTAAVTVRIGDSAAEPFERGARGYRVNRRGTRARYAAPRRSGGRLRSFRLSVAGGSFVASWRDLPLDFGNPPAVELRIGARTYRGGGGGGDGPPDDPPSLPDGAAAHETLFRGTAVLPADAPAVPDVWLRSPAELSEYLARFQSPPSIPAIDLASDSLAVVAGAPFEMPAWPWAVEVTGLTSEDDAVTVALLAFTGPMGGPVTRPPGPLAQTVFLHAVTVPAGAESVSFVRTPEERADPWH